MTVPPLVGMVHLAPLPGSPRFGGSIDAVIEAAAADAATLTAAGFPAVMVENFGDAPFFPEGVGPETVAAMTRAVSAVAAVAPTVGVNVLRNDALAALGIAAATGASMIRVNVLSGTMTTDQGVITGRAAELARARVVLAPAVQVWADVMVKHAVPPAGLTLEQAAVDTWERSGADALIVSGAGTGRAVDPDHVCRVRAVVPEAPLLLGSGVTPQDLPGYAESVQGVIVGSWLKEGGAVGNPVDPARAAEMVAAVQRVGLL